MLRVLAPVALVLTASFATPARAAAPGIELVVANEILMGAGKHLDGSLEAFVRRVEAMGGWKPGTLRGKAFTRPREALEYIRKNKVPFAFLPVHQFVEGRKELKLEVLGRAVGTDGPEGGYWGVARNEPRNYQHIEDAQGLRLATTETYDVVWLRCLLEGNVREPHKQYQLVETATGADAVAAVLAKKADVALLSNADFAPIRPRVERKADLVWVYASGKYPPSAIVSVGKFSRPADRKKMSAALDKICKNEGANTCGHMGIMYIQSGHAADYENTIQKYEEYR
jgi:ABC-type phosphate/phosphonate transport system substrate-binding protein